MLPAHRAQRVPAEPRVDAYSVEDMAAVQLDSPLHFAHGRAADSAVFLFHDKILGQALELIYCESFSFCLLLCDCQMLDEANQGIDSLLLLLHIVMLLFLLLPLLLMKLLQSIVDYLWLVRTHWVVLANQEGGILHSTISACDHLMSDALLLVQRVQAELDILPAIHAGNHDFFLLLSLLSFLLLLVFYFLLFLFLLPVYLHYHLNHLSSHFVLSLFDNNSDLLGAPAHDLMDRKPLAVHQLVTLWTFAHL